MLPGIKDIYNFLSNYPIDVQTEMVPLHKASGRFLTETIHSPLDVPPFDKAAMDGWAVLKDEESDELTLLETVAAGEVPTQPLTAGTCAAIMTGAKVPVGTGKIIRVEYTRKEGNRIFVEQKEPLENIIFRGENLKTGNPVLNPRRLGPGDIGILASLGMAEVKVAKTPSIGIITTGSELKEPGETLEDGEIFNSNGPQLMAQAEKAGCTARYYGIAPDNREDLEKAVKKGLNESDILLLSGGVSMGEFDFVPETLEKLGVEKTFHKAAIKPGKPIWFGSRPDCAVFGLPGNPVSTYILFEVFVNHLIYRFCGLEFKPDYIRAELATEIKRRTFDRTEFLPVRFQDEKVVPVSYHGSSHLNAMADAEGLIVVDTGTERVEKGSIVNVRLL